MSGTPFDYFSSDSTDLNSESPHGIAMDPESEIRGADGQAIQVRHHWNFGSGVKYVSFYVPSHKDSLRACMALTDRRQIEPIVNAPGLTVGSPMPREPDVSTDELHFSGWVYLYTADEYSPAQKDFLVSRAKSEGLKLFLRGPEWSRERSSLQRPVAFISHDSRDKDSIARPLAIELSHRDRGVAVWFDEFSLKIGDSLRESIERGLKESDHCVLVLSPNFLTNTGWTRVEFDSIFSRQLIEKKKLILPVWAGVSAKEVFEYSPSLVNTFAANWENGLQSVSDQLMRAIITSRAP